MPPDPDKHCLRELGERLSLPRRLTRAPKQQRLAPAMDLTSLVSHERIHALAATLGMAPAVLNTDAGRVLWTTLVLLLDSLNELNVMQSCCVQCSHGYVDRAQQNF